MESSYLVWIAVATVAVLALLFVSGSVFSGWGDRVRGRRKIEMSLDAGVRHLLDGYLNEFARRLGWDDESTEKLRAAGEEVLMSLAGQDVDMSGLRRLRVSVRQEKGAVVMEFLAAPQGTNFEKQIKLLEQHAVPAEQELSLRLLKHYASSVRHRHYQLNDLVTIRVERPR
ncbi:MAG: hypothetical protein J4F34_08405 [Gemmatimonadetes bacterium]|nr:hypothetical protein [Gemmatimonadota bacterium]